MMGYRNPKGQPTIEALLIAEKEAQILSIEAIARLRDLAEQRTTYYGQDYRISFRIKDFLDSIKGESNDYHSK